MFKFFAILALLFLLSCSADNLVSVDVVEIYDGDTIGAKIIGIDCYETTKNNRSYKQAYLDNLNIDDVIQKGKYSKNYLKKLYKKNNSDIYFGFMGIDKYSRALGILYFNGLNVNEKMKTQGGCKSYIYSNQGS